MSEPLAVLVLPLRHHRQLVNEVVGRIEVGRTGIPNAAKGENTPENGPNTIYLLLSNHQRWYAKWKLSWRIQYIPIAYTFFARLALICYAQSVLINKISASELSRKFVKSALLVG